MNIPVGKISYTNAVPFYHGLEDALAKGRPAGQEKCRYHFLEAYPTKVNLALRRGKVQMAPISSLEYLNHQDLYWLLPDLGISARDFSGSVILFSKEKIEGLHHAKIALTRQSLSSAMLLRLLFKFKYKFQSRFVSRNVPPDQMLRGAQAALGIGDEALFFESDDFYYKYDLSELWWNWAEKPFCFSVWAVRRDFAKAHPDVVAFFHRRLKQNLEKNLADLESLMKDALKMSFMDPQFPKIFGYLFNLNYGLDASIREGLELFYRLAYRFRTSPRPRDLEFFRHDVASPLSRKPNSRPPLPLKT